MADKLISYLFVLCLWIDDFSVDVGVVANDLKMTVKKSVHLDLLTAFLQESSAFADFHRTLIQDR